MHTITFSHREYVRDIYAPTSSKAFEIQSWALNPGVTLSFPWLSQIASNFEDYQFIQLIFTFKSTVTDFAATSGQVGQVVMATQYNPDQDIFADKEEMMLYEGGMSCKTTESLIHGIECDPAKNSGPSGKYVRVGNLSSSEDLKDYDHGRTSLAVLNCPSAYQGQQIGELWVSYTVHLRKPKFMTGNGYTIPRDLYTMQTTQITANGYPWDPTKLLRAAKNSLGTTVTMTTPAQALTIPTGADTDNLNMLDPTQNATAYRLIATIDFPSSFSGVVRIRFIIGTSATNAAIPQILAVSGAPLTISRFKDVPSNTSVSPYTAWTHIINSDDNQWAPPDPPTQWNAGDMELHLRISPSHLGRQNRIFLATTNVFPTGFYNVPTLSIDLYNSYISYSDTGSNDAIEMLNNNTGLPVSNPL